MGVLWKGLHSGESYCKESIAHILVALEGILQSENENILSMAMNTTVKLVNLLGNSMRHFCILDLVLPLSRLLSLHGSLVVISSAVALNHILMRPMPIRIENDRVWEILEETSAVGSIVNFLEDYVKGIQPLEHFIEMASLLQTILWRWPTSRYPVWSNSVLMERLGDVCVKHDSTVAIAVLRLYSALALCGNGAMKLIGNGEKIPSVLVHCMQSSQPRHARMEAFRFLQYLMRPSVGSFKLTEECWQTIVKGIINVLSEWRSPGSEKVPADQLSLVVEACRSAFFACRVQQHHSSFWIHRIDRVLLTLLVNNFSTDQSPVCGPAEELIVAQKIVSSHGFPVIRPYIWDILGLLAQNCAEDFHPDMYGSTLYLDRLIACACLVAVYTIREGRLSSDKDFPATLEREPACRAVSIMVFSPCKHIAAQSRQFLSCALLSSGNEYLEGILASFKPAAIRDALAASDYTRLVISLMVFTCYLSLPQYQDLIVASEAVTIFICFIKMWVSKDVRVERSSIAIASQVHATSSERTCCFASVEDWEGRDVILFFSLQALSKLMQLLEFTSSTRSITSQCFNISVDLGDSQDGNFFVWLKEIRNNDSFGPGPRWLASYCLSFFGIYGFPSRLGKLLEKALNENELSDLQLVLSGGYSIRVHSIILKVRCPALLPLPPVEKAPLDGSDECKDEQHFGKCQREVRLSTRVDSNALMKLLEFVYTGILLVDEGLVKQLKILAKHCNLQVLSDLLNRNPPKWGNSIIDFDLTPAFSAAGYSFSDITLIATETEGMPWACCMCSLSTPHVHAHKVILWSSCDYLHALFQSGMKERKTHLDASPGFLFVVLQSLTDFDGKLPKPSQDCLWNNMDTEQQVHELTTYIQLSSLSEFWLLEDVREESINVVTSCLRSKHQLPLKIIQFAANLTQQEIVEAAVSCLAPIYPRMRDSGELEVLDEALCDLVRASGLVESMLTQANRKFWMKPCVILFGLHTLVFVKKVDLPADTPKPLEEFSVSAMNMYRKKAKSVVVWLMIDAHPYNGTSESPREMSKQADLKLDGLTSIT
ncbi:hypothetical protein ACLOJK_021659 [Asimina triloba]